MKYKVLIVDDELEALNRLRLHVDKFSSLEFIGACQNGNQALGQIKVTNPDIVLIDIEMPGMNGVEVLQNCIEPFPYFIFVTAYSQYAIEAFEQNAIDYILKPYSSERIESALKKAIDRLEKDYLIKITDNLKNLLYALSNKTKAVEKEEFIKRIAVKSIGKTAFINVDDIIAIEAADQYVEIETINKKYTVRESMDQLDNSLDPNVFFRVHRSFIVNNHHVLGMENYDKNISMVVLRNHRKIKISNSRKPDFKKWMGL
ncbi:LytR/AlgR family response regulator transcription factor [Flagellimonas myxillae]|uniref:LytR/AlgR family response regulator transcription factor n=1 Tax=Flagellimonas myxillae TaxID=2942214 RepID=UPI00201EC7A4|nr:LytTR family DNA-binding domain-containing protein [Muricauda myxillae]MCL6264856.1 LytTR family DNA-binding domain-containing protein [Muricauda myxillae]